MGIRSVGDPSAGGPNANCSLITKGREMRKLNLLFVVALVGCATVGTSLRTQAEIKASLDPYGGGPIRNLVAIFGMPQTQSEMLGNKVYSWNSSELVTTSTPVTTTTTTTGTIGEPRFGTIPYRSSNTSQSRNSETRELNCRLDAAVNSDGYIVYIGIDGAAAPCQRFYAGP